MSDIIVHPEFEEYYKQIQELRQKIVQSLEEREKLKSHILPNIEMEYYIHIEPTETQRNELQCEVFRLRREIKLIQVYINKEEPIDVEAIQKQLDGEYAEYVQETEEQYQKRMEALERKKYLDILPEEERKKLSTMYRKIVPKLHPDLNTQITPMQVHLFTKANQAYAYGDIKEMEEILLQIEELSLMDYKPPQTLTSIQKEIKQLTKQYQHLQVEIEEIKQDFPYNQLEFVHSDEAIALKIQELKNEIQQLNIEIAHYREHKEALLANHEQYRPSNQ